MSGSSIFLDTNIVLYLLSGDTTIAEMLHEKTVYISFVTELEILGYNEINAEELKLIKYFLNEVTIIDINSPIKQITIELRKSSKIKLPDALIAASSIYLNVPLLTSDKYLTKLSNVNIIFYEK